MSLFVDLSFNAVLTRAEQALLTALPDWPTQQKLGEADRDLAPRLKRLGRIEVERCKDDPIQIWFDVYAGVTALGRTVGPSGIVRLSNG